MQGHNFSNFFFKKKPDFVFQCVLMVPGEKAVLMNVLKHAAEIGADVILSMAGVAVSQDTEELIASIVSWMDMYMSFPLSVTITC